MHENTIATIREEEGYGLVLPIRLRPLRIRHREVYLLPYLVQRGERFTTAVDPLARCQRQHRVDAARVVRASLYKREGQQLYLTRVVVDVMARLGENPSLGILDDNAPGIFLNLDTTVSRAVDNRVTHALRGPHLPLSLRLESIAEHHVVGILILGGNRRCQHPDTGCPRRNEFHLDLQLRIVHVGSIREVEHLHTNRPVAIEVKRLTGRQSVAFPLHQSLTLQGIETDDGVSEEIGV